MPTLKWINEARTLAIENSYILFYGWIDCRDTFRAVLGGHLYTCRYSSGHLIPMIQSCQDELGIKCPLEYLQVYR